MSPVDGLRFTPTYGFPRVSGDEPGVVPQQAAQAVFSPRERG